MAVNRVTSFGLSEFGHMQPSHSCVSSNIEFYKGYKTAQNTKTKTAKSIILDHFSHIQLWYGFNPFDNKIDQTELNIYAALNSKMSKVQNLLLMLLRML